MTEAPGASPLDQERLITEQIPLVGHIVRETVGDSGPVGVGVAHHPTVCRPLTTRAHLTLVPGAFRLRSALQT